MTSLKTIGIHVKRGMRTFFVPQTTSGVWVSLLVCVVVVNVVGIALSIVFFLRVKDTNQPIGSSGVVATTEDVDRSTVSEALQAFSRRVVEFQYRKINGVSIPEPR